ncbi:MAG TPA: methylenetetrahydrofolate--tRNA-(uracil(54)-C(5))-methyltransferase (FADH(2)-oxidizing) TrmFO [Candidatus Atribacteria bacterium]|nr:methylenetetrahydrofolate--tRNA-(uracil(54)-C(5))-methyltransferase (FADH(2)-oxidizing) TrmFO [Candidatus Atribacteria bacterium]
MKATVIGAGLAGCEAAWQLAENNVKVTLYEMRPKKMTPAHHSAKLAELVCSNSLRADGLENAVGLLKEEMRRMNSLIMHAADRYRIPAGGALAVDREKFSAYITDKIENHPNIELIREEITDIPLDQPVIIATGPLTSDGLSIKISELVHGNHLHFYDAAAPIVTYESIDRSKVFKGSRYNRGDDYINCPMTNEEYLAFYHELINAETAPVHDFEDAKVFEGCMPIETMAKRGVDTIRFGPLKPVGFVDKLAGKVPYAVVQLRQDNAEGTLYNIVGFQTRLKFGEQKRVFSMIPGLENAEFVRYGVMHRNTFINSPRLLDRFYRLRSNSNVFFAGQITGVEGYVESASSGLLAGLNLSRILYGKEPIDFTDQTAIGALAHYVSNPSIRNFQPMNVNFGIMAPLDERIKNRSLRNQSLSRRALEVLDSMLGTS